MYVCMYVCMNNLFPFSQKFYIYTFFLFSSSSFYFFLPSVVQVGMSLRLKKKIQFCKEVRAAEKKTSERGGNRLNAYAQTLDNMHCRSNHPAISPIHLSETF